MLFFLFVVLTRILYCQQVGVQKRRCCCQGLEVFDKAGYTSTRSTPIDVGTNLSNRGGNLAADGFPPFPRKLYLSSGLIHLSALIFFLTGSEPNIRHG
jgi:hypothetical protein